MATSSANRPRLEVELSLLSADFKKQLAQAKKDVQDFGKSISSTEFSSALNAQKLAIASSRAEAQSYRAELEKLRLAQAKDTGVKDQMNATRQAIADSRLEVQKLREETAKASKTRAPQENLNPTSLVAYRQNLAALTKAYDRLSIAQRESASTGGVMVSRIKNLSNIVLEAEKATGRYQRQVGNYALAQGNATGVALEFNRIIQDAPFGMMGIGNNIQQLASNWQAYSAQARVAAVASGTTVTTMSILKGAVAAILSPTNLLVLGISALTSAWTYYSMNAGKAKKATEAITPTFKELNRVQYELNAARNEGARSAAEELSKLTVLRGVIENSNIPLKDRIGAYKDLMGMYPDMFKNYNQEDALLGKLSTKYDTLSEKIVKVAKAQAAAAKITELSSKLIDEQFTLQGQQNLENKYKKQYEKFTKEEAKRQTQGAFGRSTFTNAYMRGSVSSNYRSDRNLVAAERKFNEYAGKTEATLQRITDIQNSINKLIPIATSAPDKVTPTGTGKGGKELSDLEKAFKEYRDAMSSIDKQIQLGVLTIPDATQQRLDATLSGIKNLIDAGLNPLDKRLQSLRDNAYDLLFAVQSLSPEKLKSVGIMPTTMNTSGGLTEDWFKSAQKGYQRQLDTFNARRQNKEDKEVERQISKLVYGGIKQGIDGLFSSITSLGSNFYQVMNNSISKLSSTINSVFTNVISGQISQAISKSIDSDSFKIAPGVSTKVSQAIVAGVGLAGSIVSSITKSTSYAGQGVGGALSGAASGLAIGTLTGGPVLGTIIGGAVGLIGGLFGAGSARKEAKRQADLQEKQLAEQKKQTAIMERQAALAYTSSVIGQMTNQGIVTSVDRDAFGNLTAKISGKDIQLTLDRNTSNR